MWIRAAIYNLLGDDRNGYRISAKGRRPEVIAELAGAVRPRRGVTLLDWLGRSLAQSLRVHDGRRSGRTSDGSAAHVAGDRGGFARLGTHGAACIHASAR